ncbi:MAG: phosphoribosyltransferase [Acidobacteria bacterium]|nr:phosphoribosyltransferase [Acidobacteriota bacterium]
MRGVMKDRTEAGRLLALELSSHAKRRNCLTLALPRGGVVVGFEIARALQLPLDVLIVRKLGVPWQPELAMGAIAGGGIRVLNQEVIAQCGLRTEDVEQVASREQEELERRERLYRSGRPRLDLAGRAVILADDGIATGSTVEAAIRVLRSGKAARIVVAVPVVSQPALNRLWNLADEVVHLMAPEPFEAISKWYESFPQTSDDEVRRLLDAAGQSKPVARRAGPVAV